MTIQKPFSISIRGASIDASEINLIKWRVTGDTSVAFSIEIKNNATGTVVYSLPKTTSNAIEYSLPSSTLTNGNEYKITITVWDSGNSSATSDAEIFTTSSKPTVTLTAPNGTTIGSKSYLFTANYTQAQGVALKNWLALFYDVNKNLIKQTSLITTTPLEFLYEDLGDDDTYYIEFRATSIKGLTGTTGLVKVTVLYTRPRASINLTAENANNGGIHLKWNVSQIIGQSVNSTYINNEKLNVADGVVTFDKGFKVNDTFTMKLWVESLPDMIIENEPRIITSSTTNLNIVNALWVNDPSVTLNRTMGLYASSAPPDDKNLLWIEDPNLFYTIGYNSFASIDDQRILEDTYGLSETIDGQEMLNYIFGITYNPIIDRRFSIQMTEPNTNNIWIKDAFSFDDAAISTLEGENGHLSLECYNGFLYLYEVISGIRTLLTQCPVYSGKNFVYIQQKDTGYTLHAEQMV